MRKLHWFLFALGIIAILLIAKGADFPSIDAGKKLEIRDAQVHVMSLQLQYANLPAQIQQASQDYAKLINETRPKDCDKCSFDEQLLQWIK